MNSPGEVVSIEEIRILKAQVMAMSKLMDKIMEVALDADAKARVAEILIKEVRAQYLSTPYAMPREEAPQGSVGDLGDDPAYRSTIPGKESIEPLDNLDGDADLGDMTKPAGEKKISKRFEHYVNIAKSFGEAPGVPNVNKEA